MQPDFGGGEGRRSHIAGFCQSFYFSIMILTGNGMNAPRTAAALRSTEAANAHISAVWAGLVRPRASLQGERHRRSTAPTSREVTRETMPPMRSRGGAPSSAGNAAASANKKQIPTRLSAPWQPKKKSNFYVSGASGGSQS